MQLLTITIVHGYNSNITNQTLHRYMLNQQQQEQQQQSHHYITSSSSSSSILSSLPLSSSSSSSSSSVEPLATTSNGNRTQTLSSSSSSSSSTTSSSSSSDEPTMNILKHHEHSTILHSDENISEIGSYEYIGRENTIRREPNLSFASSGCHTCQMREQAKADNLASIKKHILMRLKLEKTPNITSPVVPREIIEKFYKNNSNMFNRNNNGRGLGGDGGIDDGNNSDKNIDDGDLKSSIEGDSYSHRSVLNSPRYDSMQGDDPRMYDGSFTYDYGDSEDENAHEDYEEEFFSIVNSMYVFPTVPRMRHNRKPEIMHFSFTNNGHSTITQATLHIYIRGRDWLREYEPSILNNANENNRREINLSVNRVLRRQNSPNSTHTQKVTESRQMIPNGLGTWITIDVTDMVSNWYNNPSTNFGLVIKLSESWMKAVIVSDDSANSKPIYIEVLTKDNRKKRSKRSTSLNCSESDNEVRCCRYPLEVDFRKFNWDWIIAPTSFNAYFCNGECKLGFLQRYPHTHIMQLSTAPQPCCSPTKMSPISLLYFNNEQTLVMSTIPNMAVDKCSCS